MTHKALKQFDHMLALHRLGLAFARSVLKDHSKGMAVRNIEKREG